MESAKQWVARERKQTAEIIPMNFMMFVCSEPGWVEQRADLNLADKIDTHLVLRPSEIFWKNERFEGVVVFTDDERIPFCRGSRK